MDGHWMVRHGNVTQLFVGGVTGAPAKTRSMREWCWVGLPFDKFVLIFSPGQII